MILFVHADERGVSLSRYGRGLQKNIDSSIAINI
jgi:hypothetical protein